MQFPRVQNQLVQLAVGNSYVRHCTSGGSAVIYCDADNDHSGNYHNYWEISGLAPSAGIYDNLWKISNYDNCWQLLTMWEKNLQTISGQSDHSAHIILCDLDEGLFRGGGGIDAGVKFITFAKLDKHSISNIFLLILGFFLLRKVEVLTLNQF